MRKMMLVAAFWTGMAAAAPIDCNSLALDSNGFVSYREVEQFPNPVKKVKIDLLKQTAPFRLDACGVTVKASPGKYSFKTKTIKALASQLGQGFSWDFTLVGIQRLGGKLSYPEAAQLQIELPDGIVHTKVRVSGYFSGRYLPPDALMAVRIDNGKLLPLLYNGRFRSVEVDPKMDTMQLYIRSSRPVLWEKILLDVKNSEMTFFAKAPFPTK